MPEYEVRRGDHAIIALAACATLIFEIAITRVLSVVLWYHFAFLAVSLAMLGLGAPGVWFFLRRPSRAVLPKLMYGAAVAIPLSVIVAVKRGELLLGSGVLEIAAIVAALLVPFVFLGGIVCFLLMEAGGRAIGGMYAADLIGATIGACAVVPLMHVVPTPILLAGLALLPLAGVVVAKRRVTALTVVLAVALAGVLWWGEPFRVRHSKHRENTGDVLYEKWTPTARLTVFPDVFWTGSARQAFGWGMGSRYVPTQIEQYWIEQDGSAGTPITRLTGSPDGLDHLDFDVTSVGYQLRPPRRVCVIGAGGGRDILTALRSGAAHVDAVELNPHMIHMVSGEFGEYSGDVYHLPGVQAVASEGRSFLTRSEGNYDLIQVSLIDSWAATAAGAYALSETYLYTLESVRLYIEKLAEGGLVSISRWMRGPHQMEGLRTALLASAALSEEGAPLPLEQIAVMQGSDVATVLISETPFSGEEIARLDRIGAERGFVRHWPSHPRSYGDSMVARGLQEGLGAFERSGLVLDPPTDERPFFFQSVRAFTPVDRALLARLSINDTAARLPRLLLGIVGTLTVLLFFIPLAFSKSHRGGPGMVRATSYFAAIGIGFMLVEIPLIQRFILYLGHPSYATTVILATLLLGSGLGAWAAGHVRLGRVGKLKWLLPASVALVALALNGLFGSTLGWPLAGRVAMTAMMVGPLGFVMGFAFPLGMMRFAADRRAWLWAMNGAAGVLASIIAIALAPYAGLTGVVWLGGLTYVGACLLLPGLGESGVRK